MQRDTFLSGEGDAYFRRNDPGAVKDYVPPFFHGDYRRALEVGCGNGAILDLLGAPESHGVEPSAEAVADGSKRFPRLHLQVGTADSLPYPDGHFDMVLLGFCLYLVDRSLLFRSIAEADRVLKDGGDLGLWDFDPPRPTARPYRHDPRVTTHKMDYAGLFLANPAYSLLKKMPLTGNGCGFSEDEHDRRALWLMRKSVEAGYSRES